MRTIANLRKNTLLSSVFIILLTFISLLFTGYEDIYGSNHAYQLVLTQKLRNSGLYPYDPFADTVYSYASAFWYLVAYLSHFIDLPILLLALFILNRFLLIAGAYQLAGAMFPKSQLAPMAAAIMMATVPDLLFGGGYASNYTQQSGFSIACLLWALAATINQRWLQAGIWLGASISFNLMFGLFGVSYFLAALFTFRWNRDFLYRNALAGLLALIFGLPGIYLVSRAAAKTASELIAVWKAMELSYPYHYFPQTWELMPQIIAALLAVVVVSLRRIGVSTSQPTYSLMSIWTAVALGWYLLSWLNALYLHSLLLMHLHCVRALLVWQFISMIFLSGVVAAYTEHRYSQRHDLPLYIAGWTTLASIFWYTAIRSKMMLGLLLLAVIPWLVLWLLNRNRVSSLTNPILVLVIVATLMTVTYSVRVTWNRIRQTGNWMGTKNYIAHSIAAWARQNTPTDAVFLIPIYDKEGWIHFRHLSQRSVFLHAKDGTAWSYAPYYATEWLSRLKSLGFYEVARLDDQGYQIGQWIYVWRSEPNPFEQTYEQLDEQRAMRIAQKYKIDFWITRKNTPTTLPIVYQAGDYKVLSIYIR